MFLITILLVIIIQHIYLYIFYNDVNKIANKIQTFSYNLHDEQHDLTVYKCGNLQSNKILLILSGSYTLCFDTYVQKMVSSDQCRKHEKSKFTKYLKHPEIILQDEAEWISNTNTGAIIYAEVYNGPGYKYDIKSVSFNYDILRKISNW